MNQLLRKNQLVYLYFILFVSFSNYACKTNKADNIINTEELSDEEFNKQLKDLLKSEIQNLNPIVVDSLKFRSWQDVAQQAYKEINFHPIWVSKNVLSNSGQELYNFINEAEYYALLKEKYNFKEIKVLHDSLQKSQPVINFELIKTLEIKLTAAFFNIALHIDNGIYNEEKKKVNDNFWSVKEKYITHFTEVFAGTALKTELEKLEPQHLIYKRYKSAIYKYVSKINIFPNVIRIRDYKQDSIGAIHDARIALKYHHYLHDTLMQNDTAYILALKQFQRDNGYKDDAVLGSMTARALERDNSQKFKLLVINADRWRANKSKLNNHDKYVWVNLPSYKIRVIQQDTIVVEKNVVIGKANSKNATPNIISAIDKIILWPTWSVPQSIIKNEMKSFKGYKVTKTGNSLRVVQPPGPRNALGAVKILFPNKHSIYIHDTPTKYLFNSDYRSHSHGCVRCQDPLEVASALMQLDTFRFDYDSLIRMKEKKIATRQFTLKNPIPVYLQYFTAEADWNGKLRFYPDIYKKDETMIDVLFNNAIYKDEPKEQKKDTIKPIVINKTATILKDTLPTIISEPEMPIKNISDSSIKIE
jgi:murein L,D-transpeptidase YcbB/YkuD